MHVSADQDDAANRLFPNELNQRLSFVRIGGPVITFPRADGSVPDHATGQHLERRRRGLQFPVEPFPLFLAEQRRTILVKR